MSDELLSETACCKTGAELFRELMRIYSEANVEDYYKMGIWKDDMMKTDYKLIEAHRREAGAPNPPPLSEIPVPKVPEQKTLGMGGPGYNGMASPVMQQFMANGAKGGTGGGVVNPAVELRNAAIFISQNKLEPSRAKVLLMALSTDVRKKVMEGFTSKKIGAEAVTELEKFIAEQKKADPKSSAGSAAPKAAANRIGGVAVDELKQAAQFIAKNKLDPIKAKTILVALSPTMRKTVMQDFSTTNTGMKATEDLEKYIQQQKESEEPPAKKAKTA